MGLDVVELILRVEETFHLDLPDEDCEQVQTIGNLYRLVLHKLDIPYQPATDLPALRYARPFIPPADATTVWRTLKFLIIDQLQVDEEEVNEAAYFQADLGAD